MLSRPLRLFHVDCWGEGKTGPLDHSARFAGTRAEFRSALRHVPLAAGQTKDVVGAWLPVDALTREEGATFATRGGREYESSSEVGRHLENLKGSAASTFLDIDKLPVAEWPALLTKLRAYSGEVWSTASYRARGDTLSVRVHLHLDRELTTRDEVVSVRRSVASLLGDVCDRMTFPATAVFYCPATRGDHFVELLDGSEIVVDSLPVVGPIRRTVNRPVPVGYTATAVDRERAENELALLALRIRTCTTGLRKYTALAALSVGQRIAAGVLDRAAATEVLEEAIEQQREAYGDDVCSLEERVGQLYSGIEDGLARGPSLPVEKPTPKEVLLDTLTERPEYVTADEAAAQSPDGHILALPPGVGKSRTALRVIANSRQDAIVYSPSHALSEEHRQTLLAMGVPAADIHHQMSPLHRPAGGEEACERSRASRENTPDSEPSPFAVAIRQAHLNLKASICPRCPLRDTCPARFGTKGNHRVTFAVHAAYESVEDPGKKLVYLDEEPEPLELLTVTQKDLTTLAGKWQGYFHLTGSGHAFWSPQQVAAERVRLLEEADLADEEPQTFDPGQGYFVRQAARALRAGRPIAEDIRAGLLSYSGDVRLSAERAELLLAAPGGGLGIEDDLTPVRMILGLAKAAELRQMDQGVEAVVETDTRRDTRRGWVTLLSATPTPMAYGDLPVYAPHVADGCEGIDRDLLYLSRGSNLAFKADALGQIERARELLRLSGKTHSDKRVLLVTFKHVVAKHADALRELFPQSSVELRWFGAVAGSNLFQEGAELEVDVVVTLGDYFANRRWMFEHFAREAGLDPQAAQEAIDDAGRSQVRQELAQAHGRARDPRRTKPVTHVHIGQELPLGWEGRSSSPVFLEEALAAEREAAQDRLRGYLSSALRKRTQVAVAKVLGVSSKTVSRWARGAEEIPLKYEQPLKELS